MSATAVVTLHLPFADRRRADRATVRCDATSWAHLSKFHWVVLEDDATGLPSYVVCDLRSHHPKSLHREAYVLAHGPVPEGMVVDHVNRVRTDCRLANMRLASPSHNACNRAKAKRRRGAETTSKYKGVWRKRARVLQNGELRTHASPWVCEVRVKAQGRKHTSCHPTEREAALKYNEMAREWMGEYAVLNVLSDTDE
jgi:hypothetical protein